MRLLILTQKVDINDGSLGFFHGWIEEFAKNFETVTVICLYQGRHDFAGNVKVLSLGKETGGSRIKYLINLYKYIWQERENYDIIFVHMNQIYVILGGIFWRLLGKKIGFWYAHGQTSVSLKIAEKLTNYIFTPTADSFRLVSKKINVLGHGIDTEKFNIVNNKIKSNSGINITTIGRISPSKDYETLILAMASLRERQPNKQFKINIIGRPGNHQQEKYLESLRVLVAKKKLNEQINFVGSIPNKDVVNYLRSADLFVNMSHTGGLDKAVLEAMASGLPIITCNETFEKILGVLKNKLMFTKNNWPELADRLAAALAMSPEEKIGLGRELREIIVKNHNLASLINKIKIIYQTNGQASF